MADDIEKKVSQETEKKISTESTVEKESVKPDQQEKKLSKALKKGAESKNGPEEGAKKETADSLWKEGEEKVKIKRAKGNKNVTTGVCHISATFNNTKVVFTDVTGKVLSWSSAGRCNFRGSRKSTAYAAQMATTEAAKVAMGHGLKTVSVKVKGPGMGRDAAVRTLPTLGLFVSDIQDVTPIPHNGCPPKKRRRV